MPDTGGCECSRLVELIAAINSRDGREFRHEFCLDRLERNTPQPEASFVDAADGTTMVVERKSLVWPPDAMARHRQDHRLASQLIQRLGEACRGYPVGVYLPQLNRMRVNEVTAFGESIVSQVLPRLPRILAGGPGVGCGSHKEGWTWRVVKEDSEDREFMDEPATGLVVRWETEAEEVPSCSVTPGLISELKRLLRAVDKKFRHHAGARRVLVMEGFGDARWLFEDDWSAIRNLCSLPESIDELWTCMTWEPGPSHEYEEIFRRLT
jgi:hypothetical protein